MPAIEDIQFDTSGWEPLATSEDSFRTWGNHWGDVMSISFSGAPPSMPSLFRLHALREFHDRHIEGNGGTILSLDLLQVKGVAVGKLLYKSQQSAGGWGYVGTLMIPFRDFHYSICLQTVEQAGDEVRADHVWGWLHESHPAEDCTRLWFGLDSAPTDPQPVLPCLADEERWDGTFPDHPLSRLRSELSRLIPTLVVSREVKNSAPHRG